MRSARDVRRVKAMRLDRATSSVRSPVVIAATSLFHRRAEKPELERLVVDFEEVLDGSLTARLLEHGQVIHFRFDWRTDFGRHFLLLLFLIILKKSEYKPGALRTSPGSPLFGPKRIGGTASISLLSLPTPLIPDRHPADLVHRAPPLAPA